MKKKYTAIIFFFAIAFIELKSVAAVKIDLARLSEVELQKIVWKDMDFSETDPSFDYSKIAPLVRDKDIVSCAFSGDLSKSGLEHARSFRSSDFLKVTQMPSQFAANKNLRFSKFAGNMSDSGIQLAKDLSFVDISHVKKMPSQWAKGIDISYMILGGNLEDSGIEEALSIEGCDISQVESMPDNWANEKIISHMILGGNLTKSGLENAFDVIESIKVLKGTLLPSNWAKNKSIINSDFSAIDYESSGLAQAEYLSNTKMGRSSTPEGFEKLRKSNFNQVLTELNTLIFSTRNTKQLARYHQPVNSGYCLMVDNEDDLKSLNAKTEDGKSIERCLQEGLSKLECRAIRNYTNGNTDQILNGALRHRIQLSETKNEIERLQSAIIKLPQKFQHKGCVIRSLDLAKLDPSAHEKIMQKYRLDHTFTEESFQSSTLLNPLAGRDPMNRFEYDTQLVIASCCGKNITNLSTWESTEKEVLFQYGTQFKVEKITDMKKREKSGKVKTYIVLREIPKENNPGCDTKQCEQISCPPQDAIYKEDKWPCNYFIDDALCGEPML